MTNYRNIGVYFLNIALLIVIPIYILPNLSSDLKNYKSERKILQTTRIDQREYTRKFRKRIEESLILIMTDGKEIKLTTHEESWNEIQDKKYIGKEVKYYLAKHRESGTNPIQLEIENKIIFDYSENVKWNYILIVFTIGLTIYSSIKIKHYFKN